MDYQAEYMLMKDKYYSLLTAFNENKSKTEAMSDLLREWLSFSEDVVPSDAMGAEIIKLLRKETKVKIIS